ncbi:MAG: phosphatidate cytidylyltransferase, partial [Thermodesulfobacteriota bacterium]
MAAAWSEASRRAWGVLYCGGLFACLLLLAARAQGRALLLFAIFCVIAADVGAYFCGHLWGRRKLAPSVSPGKTIEGALGGAAAAAALGAVYAGLWLPDTGPGLGALLGLILAAVSVAGDLLESALKRSAGVKDSGGVLPGHGGVLDRVDGILPAVALFLLIRGVWWP